MYSSSSKPMTRRDVEELLKRIDGSEELDLSNCNLSYIDLSGFKLSGANLRGANLRGANLRETFLVIADLREANLFQANLINANLIRAKLTKANLGGANLTNAFLMGANLRQANLNDAILDGVDLSDTNLDEVYISEGGRQQLYDRGVPEFWLTQSEEKKLIQKKLQAITDDKFIRQNLVFLSEEVKDAENKIQNGNLSYGLTVILQERVAQYKWIIDLMLDRYYQLMKSK